MVLVLAAGCSDNGPVSGPEATGDGITGHISSPSSFSGGISGYSGLGGSTCMSCHSSPNDAAPTLTLTGPQNLAPGQTGNYTLTITPASNSDGVEAGLDVAADGGTLVSVSGENTQMVNGELTHNSPKAGAGGSAVSWDFQWVAPGASGVYRLYAAALSANGANGTNGDETATVNGYQITVTGGTTGAPIANAGADQMVTDSDNSGSEMVTLDGSMSSDDGTIVSWVWTEGATQLGSGVTITVDFAVGVHTVTLEVTDDSGLTATDEVVVTVRAPGAGGSGEALYNANCAFCHGDPTSNGPAPDAPQKVAGARVCSIEGSIYGTAVFPDGVPEMQFLQGSLSGDDISAISDYLNSFDVSGQQRYETACSGCHGLNASGGRVGEGVRGASYSENREAIFDEDAMRFLACLPDGDIAAISDYLSQLGGGGDGDDDHGHGGGDDDDHGHGNGGGNGDDHGHGNGGDHGGDHRGGNRGGGGSDD